MHELRRRFLLNCLRGADIAVMATAFAIALLMSGQYAQPESPQDFLAVRISLANFAYFAGFSVIRSTILAYTCVVVIDACKYCTDGVRERLELLPNEFLIIARCCWKIQSLIHRPCRESITY